MSKDFELMPLANGRSASESDPDSDCCNASSPDWMSNPCIEPAVAIVSDDDESAATTDADAETTDSRDLTGAFIANRDVALQVAASVVNSVMSTTISHSEINYVKDHIDFNILLMGAPRIGKSELTNALTGNRVCKAQTSAQLSSCTQRTDKYEVRSSLLDGSNRRKRSRVFVWDTKGIEHWQDAKLLDKLFQEIDRIRPIAVIYCAAPGTFANLKQVGAVLTFCFSKEIFCAAVMTNMWSGSKEARTAVMQDLESLLSDFGPRSVREFETDDSPMPMHEVIMFGDKALCTMVNSKPFINPDFSSVEKPVRGIDELTHCIMQSLSEDKVRGWCLAVLGNRSFWKKLHHRTNGFFVQRYEQLKTLAALLHDGAASATTSVLEQSLRLLSLNR